MVAWGGPISMCRWYQFSHSVVSDSLQPHGLQHTRPPCPSPTPGVYWNSCTLAWKIPWIGEPAKWLSSSSNWNFITSTSFVHSDASKGLLDFTFQDAFPSHSLPGKGGYTLTSLSIWILNSKSVRDLNVRIAVAAAAKSLQSCMTLCDPRDSSPLGSSVPGILQARILEWVAISFSNAWKVKRESEVAQSCPTLSDPMDCSLPGSSVHGIFQARVLEWGAIAFSKRYLQYNTN